MPTPAVPLLLGEKGVRSMSRAAVPSMPSESSSEPPSEPPGVGSPPAQRVDATLSHGLSWEVEGSDKRKGSDEKLRSEETLAAAVQLDRPGPDGSAGDLLPDVAALKAPEWPAAVHVQDELELAARYAPILMLDDREPFLPDAVGYRLFRENAPSPSFPREIRLEAPGASLSPDVPITLAIEYAIWWDWDIEHLYELEHVWVYVDAGGRPVRVEASWHGEWRDLRLGQAGGAVLEGTRPVVYVKPGKHALAAQPGDFEPLRDAVALVCSRLAGVGGVWVTPLFAGRLTSKTPLADRVVHTYLQGRRFVPSFSFGRRFDIGPDQLRPWEALEAAIPDRVAWWAGELARRIPPGQRRWIRIGHRGAAAHGPENSATAVRLSARLGADMVELDVRLTKDGVPVVIHDEVLDRVTTGQGPVADHTWEELRPLRLRDPVTGEPRDEGLMTLADALALCREEFVGAYVDVKDGAAIPAIVAAVRQHFYPHGVVIGSTRPEDVRAVRQLAPELRVAWLVGLPVRPIPELLAELQAMDGTYLHLCWERAGARPDQLLTPEDVAQVHRAGKGLVIWHEERPEVIAGLRQLGVDAVCSDRPELLV